MKDIMTYDNFIGSVHFSAEDETFYGKIEGIDDLVLFEGQTVEGLKLAFKDAVEDYTAACEKYGKQVEKSYKGSFNVRIGPELHKKIARATAKMGIPLNQFIQKAVEDELRLVESFTRG
jgi:predicted HicB family RNase H-like nuclease